MSATQALLGTSATKQSSKRGVDCLGLLVSIVVLAALGADLRPDASELCQPRNPIGTAALADIRWVGVKLAIDVDLARSRFTPRGSAGSVGDLHARACSAGPFVRLESY